jgi:formylglycine-generating enzyme
MPSTFRFQSFISMIITAAIVIGCSDAGPQPPTGNEQVKVSGKVSPETSGEDVRGIAITMGSRTVSTDTTGAYAFDSVDAGTYTVIPSKAGRLFSPTSRNVTVEKEAIAGVDFQLLGRTGTDSIHMVLIPAGTYMRGVDSSYKKIMEGSVPKHRVTLTRSFWIGIHEVTQEQWLRVMQENNSQFKGDRKPITNITWVQALEFCNAMSDLHGLTRVYSNLGRNPTIDWDANGYRLPTEAEWEYAAAAGDTSVYYGVPDLPPDHTIEEHRAFVMTLTDYGWIQANSSVDGVLQPHEVGLLKANAFGLYDMLGNVREWTTDCWGGYSPEESTDPNTAGDCTPKSYKGGLFGSAGADDLSIRFRSHNNVNNSNGALGIRVSRSR